MEEFNQNEMNHTQNVDINSNRQQETRVPEYSFWAEQMSGNNVVPPYAPQRNNWDYGYPQMEVVENKQSKKKKKALRFIWKAACFGILAGIGFLGVQSIYYRINPEAVKDKSFFLGSFNSGSNEAERIQLKVSSTEPGSVEMTTKTSVSNVVDETMPSIVSIHSVSTQAYDFFGQEFSSEGSGSGIIVGKNEEELLIATNNHVVEGTNKITVTFIDGKEMEAVIKGTDATADLAVITVDISAMEKATLDAIKVARIGNSDEVKVGEMTVAIGNALGYGQSVTVGYVSAKDRKVEVSDGYSYKTMVLLQTDAAINPGNSGGALLNVDGEVIGINTIKYTANEIEGMGYAIPISRAIPIINDLMSREILKAGEKGFLGVTPTDVTEEVSELYNIPIGVYLSEVMKDGAAEQAGLQQGDIITKIDGNEITSSVQLRETVSSIKAGTEIEITYMRSIDGSYQEQKLNVKLGARPEVE